MSTLLAIDPGMNSPGVALFFNNQVVSVARVMIPEALKDLPEDGQRWLGVSTRIGAWAASRAPTRITTVVYEKPQWYQRKDGGSKGDPNKLAGVLAVACGVVGCLSVGGDIRVVTPEPARWIGQLSKECPRCVGERLKSSRKNRWYAKNCPDCHGSAWETPRGRRIRSRLTPAELAWIPDQNDAIDATGIGLWAVGRLEPRRAYSNS